MLLETTRWYFGRGARWSGPGLGPFAFACLPIGRHLIGFVRRLPGTTGFGWSICPVTGMSPPRSGSIESYADQIAEMISVLGLPQQTDVLGNGLGGFISVALAIRHGGKFDRLIVADALAAFPEPGKEALRVLARTVREKGMAAGLDAAIQRMFPPSFIQAFPEIVDERKKVLLQMDPAVFSGLCIALTQVNFEPSLSASPTALW